LPPVSSQAESSVTAINNKQRHAAERLRMQGFLLYFPPSKKRRNVMRNLQKRL